MEKSNLMSELNKLYSEYKENVFFGKKIAALMNKVRNAEPYILVLGQFSVGKSEFINALLKDRLLISHSNETTSAITKIKNNSDSKMIIKYIDGSEEEEVIDTKIIKEYTTFKGASSNSIAEIEIHKPLNILDDNLSIVDSPGLNSLRESAQETTESLLKYASTVVYLFNCERGIDQKDTELLKKLYDTNTNIIFIGNRKDLVSEQTLEEVLAYTKENIKDFGIENIATMSAKQALEGYINQDQNKIDQSNIVPVENLIKDYVKNNTALIDQFKRFSNELGNLKGQITEYEKVQNKEKILKQKKLEQLINITKLQYDELAEFGEMHINSKKTLLKKIFTEYAKKIQILNEDNRRNVIKNVNEVIRAIKKNSSNNIEINEIIEKLERIDNEITLVFKNWEKQVDYLTHELYIVTENEVENDIHALNLLLLKSSSDLDLKWSKFENKDFKIQEMYANISDYQALIAFNEKVVDLNRERHEKLNKLAHQSEKIQRLLNNNNQALNKLELERNQITLELNSMEGYQTEVEEVRKWFFFKEEKLVDNYDEINQKQQSLREKERENRDAIDDLKKKINKNERELEEIKIYQGNLEIEIKSEKEKAENTFVKELSSLMLGDKKRIKQSIENNEIEIQSHWAKVEDFVSGQFEKYLNDYRNHFKSFVREGLEIEINKIKGELVL